METRIIIDEKVYNRLTDIERNFNEKVEEVRKSYKDGLEKAIKGDLIKILWVKDKRYADIKGCDLSDEGISYFVSSDSADFANTLSGASYNREELMQADKNKTESSINSTLNDNDDISEMYEHTISNYKKAIRNSRLAFWIMFAAWIIMIIQYILK